MIILNIELGRELEKKFYERANEKKLSYLEYVQKLIIEDLETYENILEERKKNKQSRKPAPFSRV
ncbi:hypothetical protein [Arcobacter arenosus]|jgi:hypothetical protein|uniref:Uncharacterized protein n=1 Tax=Arcobacter arenosus TaxID=2576037 RepID=A0A5R8Y1Y0_9BACT|nr:hypothetical protein [Arcobacter arenosus]TLP38475.1 hypothetical protein FDK22_08370 [Arcobacter arenosus]